jgi:hypothetical protein
MDESDVQSQKHDKPRISTLLGIIIDLSHDRENAFDSIRTNREFDSKEIEQNVLVSLKESAQIRNIDSETHVRGVEEECC